ADPAADLGGESPGKPPPVAQQTDERGRPAHALGVHDRATVQPAQRHIGEPQAPRSEDGPPEEHRPFRRGGAREGAGHAGPGREEEGEGRGEEGDGDASGERAGTGHRVGLSSTTSTDASNRVASSGSFRSSTRATGRGGVPPSSVCSRVTTWASVAPRRERPTRCSADPPSARPSGGVLAARRSRPTLWSTAAWSRVKSAPSGVDDSPPAA